MANEIVNKQERTILVQVNLDTNTERVVMRNPYGGGYTPVQDPAQAQAFENTDKAQKIAAALNGLYTLTGDNYEIRIVHEVIDRQYVNPPDAETLQ
ncbi:hypothetical protein MUA90_05800 [Staphylococcus sp. IVB6181]|uniref:hypothetical protein n=1 Tax=Staphylococcus sp. IVB6181 TaxID=2929481 RepID=UPI0021D2EB89|nr:hypothetical protein [Staphylococcus sp. IVB6181]UXV35981.1 hypothetical protein MUA90_05800 [Staphylococcus sp. IVB6181]